MNPKQHPCFVLCDVGGGSALCVARSLGPLGVPVCIVSFGDDPTPLQRSRFVAGAIRVDRSPDAEQVSSAMQQWMDRHGHRAPALLMPLTDVAAHLLSVAREQFAGFGRPCIPAPELVIETMDKSRAAGLARRAGLVVPRSGYARTVEEAYRLAETHTFPVIVKPAWWAQRGDTAFKVLVYGSKEDYLEQAPRLIQKGASLVVDEFVPGPTDHTYCCLFYRSSDGLTSRVCTIVQTHTLPPDAGVIAMGRVQDVPQAREETERFLTAVDYRGIGGITFKEHEGKLHYIEVNPRLEYVAGAAARAGVDLARMAYSDLVLGDLVAGPARPRTIYWLDAPKCAELAVRHRGTMGRFWPDLLCRLFSFKTAHSLWRWNDPRPVFAYLFRGIRTQLRGEVGGNPPRAAHQS